LSESRPLRVLPAAFLCAIVQILQSGLDAGDLHGSKPLAVALLLAMMLAAAEFDDTNLVVTTLFNHFSGHLGTADQRLANSDLVTVCNQQHFVEVNAFAGADFQLLDFQRVAFFNAILLATGLDNCVHLYFPQYSPQWRDRLACLQGPLAGHGDGSGARILRDSGPQDNVGNRLWVPYSPPRPQPPHDNALTHPHPPLALPPI